MTDAIVTRAEAERLAALESTIQRGLQTFVDVGMALREIRDGRLYRATHDTFEDYCQERWGWARRYAYYMIDAATAAQNVHNCAQIAGPANEAQARPLTRLEPEQQREAWREAVETAPQGRVTGAHVEQVVERMMRPAIHGPRGDYYQLANDVKECAVCGELGAADLDYCPYCHIPQDERVAYVQEERQKHVHVSQNSGNNEWYTPPEYIEAARTVMGGIDCDPASSDKANETVRATTYYTAETDGLGYEWPGRVWMNPPYAKGLVEEFATALVEQLGAPITQACVLVNNATETGWFQMMLDKVNAVCFLKGRIKYLNSSGKPENSPLQGQAVLYFGDRVAEFAERFSEFGKVLYAIR